MVNPRGLFWSHLPRGCQGQVIYEGETGIVSVGDLHGRVSGGGECEEWERCYLCSTWLTSMCMNMINVLLLGHVRNSAPMFPLLSIPCKNAHEHRGVQLRRNGH